jgi:Zn-dependent protease with chaperone function
MRTEQRELLSRGEREWRTDPRRHRNRLILMGLLGFVGLLLPWALAFACLGSVLWAWPAALSDGMGFATLALGLGLLIGQWVRLPLPPGHLLDFDQATALREEVEQLRVLAGAPKLAGILITDEADAALLSLPRILGLSWSRHYLLLGLPLLQQLQRDELRAVIAHELGHFHLGTGWTGGWVYRLRQTWGQIQIGLLEQRGLFALPSVLFLSWYVPRFETYSWLLAREDERRADLFALRHADPRAFARALVRSALINARFERNFQWGMDRRNRREPEVPTDYYEELRDQLRPDPDTDAALLQRLLIAPASAGDTHPALAERILASGQALPDSLPEPVREPASRLLGELETQLMRQWGAEWADLYRADWREAFDQASEQRRRLDALEREKRQHPQEFASASELAILTFAERGPESALPRLRQAAADAPDDAPLQLALGQALCRLDDPACVEPLRAAFRIDPGLRVQALPLIEAHLREHGLRDELVALAPELDQLQQSFEQDARARSGLFLGDRLLPHGLQPAALAELLTTLQADKRLVRAWLCQKRLSQALGPPHFVLVLQWRWLSRLRPPWFESIGAQLRLPGTLTLLDWHDLTVAQYRVLSPALGTPVLEVCRARRGE